MNYIEKLNLITRLANENFGKKSLIQDIGSMTVYAGLVEFSAIQAYRAFEQIHIKSLLDSGQKYSKPKQDEFFYDEKIDTRKIIVAIKKMLPLRILKGENKETLDEVKLITGSVSEYVENIHKFLNVRNIIIHHIGNPRKNTDDIEGAIKDAKAYYDKIIKNQGIFMPRIAKFTLSKEQRKIVYGLV